MFAKLRQRTKEKLNQEILKDNYNKKLFLMPFFRIYSRRILRFFDWKSALNFPPYVQIENTNFCNTSCIMCPHDKMIRKKGFIDLTLFRKIIDEIAKEFKKLPFSITLAGFGEPFLDKNFVEELRYCKEKGIKVETFTNASLLKPTICKEIIGNLDILHIALDSVSKRSYESIRSNLNFEEVEDNIMYLLDLKKARNMTLPKVIVGTHEMEQTKDEIPLFIQKWRRVADEVSVSTTHEWTLPEGWLNGVKFSKHQAKHRAPCMRLWNFLNILWTGEVNICCSDFDGEEIVGDLKKNTLLEIWRGKRLQELRKLHLSREFHKIPICAKCSQWKYAPSVQPRWWEPYLILNPDIDYKR